MRIRFGFFGGAAAGVGDARKQAITIANNHRAGGGRRLRMLGSSAPPRGWRRPLSSAPGAIILRGGRYGETGLDPGLVSPPRAPRSTPFDRPPLVASGGR